MGPLCQLFRHRSDGSDVSPNSMGGGGEVCLASDAHPSAPQACSDNLWPRLPARIPVERLRRSAVRRAHQQTAPPGPQLRWLYLSIGHSGFLPEKVTPETRRREIATVEHSEIRGLHPPGREAYRSWLSVVGPSFRLKAGMLLPRGRFPIDSFEDCPDRRCRPRLQRSRLC